jgi:hypothetical protein
MDILKRADLKQLRVVTNKGNGEFGGFEAAFLAVNFWKSFQNVATHLMEDLMTEPFGVGLSCNEIAIERDN